MNKIKNDEENAHLNDYNHFSKHSNSINNRTKKRISRSSIVNNLEKSIPASSVLSGSQSKIKYQDNENSYSPNAKFQDRLKAHATAGHKRALRDLSTDVLKNQYNKEQLTASKDNMNFPQNQNRSVQSKSVYSKQEIKSKLPTIVSI